LAVTKALNEQCPMSLGIVHRLIHSAKNKTLKECFIQDYNICQKSIVDPNFAEGVRTVLVDRGAIPNWSHKHILQVTP
jgi:enoyl-CoA hydratase/carnithine racemase